MIFFNEISFLFVAVVFGLAFFLHPKREDRFENASTGAFFIVFTVCIFAMIWNLADLTDPGSTGRMLSFVLCSNAYAGLLKSVIWLRDALKKGRACANQKIKV